MMALTKEQLQVEINAANIDQGIKPILIKLLGQLIDDVADAGGGATPGTVGAQLLAAETTADARTAIGATATGSSLITATDAAAARTAIGAAEA